jgi:DNA-3-methyladenine glycosylase
MDGIEEMVRRRGVSGLRLLCAGPGRLCQALGLTLAEDGTDLTKKHGLWVAAGKPAERVRATPRVGLTVAKEVPWRFVEEGTRFSSRAVRWRRGS